MGPPLLLAAALGCVAPLPPTADAGADVYLTLGETLALTGDAWSDDTIVEWRWSILRAPSGASASPSPHDAPETEITPDRAGYYTLGLEVTDAWGSTSATDAINLLVEGDDLPPVAHLEALESGDPVALYLDGRGSYDPEDESLGYNWSVLLAPEGSSAVITPASLTGTGILTPDLSGIYVVGLSVEDGRHTSDRVTVSWQHTAEED